MNFFDTIKESLNQKSTVSSMRINVYWIMVLATILILCLGINVFMHSHEVTYNWIGATTFLAGITALIATALIGKAQQKKTELKE